MDNKVSVCVNGKIEHCQFRYDGKNMLVLIHGKWVYVKGADLGTLYGDRLHETVTTSNENK